VVSHVCLGFLQRRLGRSSTLCGDLKGSTHGAKETAHLRDIWNDLTVFHRCLELPQKRVGLFPAAVADFFTSSFAGPIAIEYPLAISGENRMAISTGAARVSARTHFRRFSRINLNHPSDPKDVFCSLFLG
jgi:hypothetical protein